MKRILFLAFVSFAMTLPLFAQPHESVIDIFEGYDFMVFPQSQTTRDIISDVVLAQRNREFAIVNNGRKLYFEAAVRSSGGVGRSTNPHICNME